MNHGLHQLLMNLRANYTNPAAFLCQGRKGIIQRSFQQFEEDITNCAARCWRLPEKRVGIWGYNSYEWLVTALGLLLAGKNVIMLDGNLSDSDLLGLVEYGDVEALAAETELAQEARSLFPGHGVYDYQTLNGSGMKFDFEPDEADFMCFTSGTSKSAKGVVLSTEALKTCVELAKPLVPGQEKDKCFVPLPFHHIFGFTTIFHVLNKNEIVCLGREIRYLQQDLLELQPEVVYLVPSMVKFLMEKGTVPASLKIMVSGAGRCNPEYSRQLKRKQIELINYYGLSETFGVICSSGPTKSMEWMKCYEGIEAFQSENGELCLKLPAHMSEYYKKPLDTAEVLRGDILHTGDACDINGDGFIKILGRMRDTIVLENGEKLHAEDVDEALAEMPRVKELAVFGNDGTVIVAVVPGDLFDENEAKSFLAAYNRRRPIYQHISDVWIYPGNLPRTATGKLKRFQIEQEYRRRI